MIRIKKDGMEITVESLEEYNIVMGITPEPIAVNGLAQFQQALRGNAAKEFVFLGEKEKELFDVFTQFPEGLHTAEAAALIGIDKEIASSRCYILKIKGVLVRREGHWGYVVSPDIDKYEIVVKQ